MINIDKRVIDATLEKQKALEYKLVERPYELHGSTVKISPPDTPHSYYITVNKIVRDGWPDMPFEMFVESKNIYNLDLFKAISIAVSTVFREHSHRVDGDPMFFIHQMKTVPAIDQSYFLSSKRYNSILHHIMEEVERMVLAIQKKESVKDVVAEQRTLIGNAVVKNARPCSVCGAKAVVRVDGCDKCLECDASTCG